MQDQSKDDKTIPEKRIFASGASSSKNPRFDLLPGKALERIAKRFELGLEVHGERAWNAASQNQQCLLDEAWVIERSSHAIFHAYKLIRKIRRGEPLIASDDDAAAIGWAGMCLCEATRAMEEARALPQDPKVTYQGDWEILETLRKTLISRCAEPDKSQQRIDPDPFISRERFSTITGAAQKLCDDFNKKYRVGCEFIVTGIPNIDGKAVVTTFSEAFVSRDDGEAKVGVNYSAGTVTAGTIVPLSGLRPRFGDEDLKTATDKEFDQIERDQNASKF